jgi:large subunit ribosomal protein L20
MPRVKRGTIKAKRRRNILAETKGYRFGRSTKKKQAREAIFHAGNHAFAHRRDKKNDFRRLFQVRINAKLREIEGPSYSKFINLLKKKQVTLNRKMLAELALNEPEVFEKVVQEVK